jgi:hypothetical protein
MEGYGRERRVEEWKKRRERDEETLHFELDC